MPRDYADPGGPTADPGPGPQAGPHPGHPDRVAAVQPGRPGELRRQRPPRTSCARLTAGLQNRFDIVSWDPRGHPAQRPRPLLRPQRQAGGGGGGGGSTIDPAPTRPEDQQALADAYRAGGEACLRWSGELLRHVGTDSTAEDLERIRIALGEEKLTFIGHSAGTLLGAVYADRYPQRVRAFVLDGPIDPSLTLDQMTLAQAKGFESGAAVLLRLVRQDGHLQVAARPTPTGRPALLALMDRIRQEPLKASAEPDRRRRHLRERHDEPAHRPLAGGRRWATPWPPPSGATAPRWPPWPATTRTAGRATPPTPASRSSASTIPPPGSSAAYPPLAEASKAQAPVFGPVFTWAALSCGMWSVPSTLEPKPTRAAGAPPIMVVGTTGDPATPAGLGARRWPASSSGASSCCARAPSTSPTTTRPASAASSTPTSSTAGPRPRAPICASLDDGSPLPGFRVPDPCMAQQRSGFHESEERLRPETMDTTGRSLR